jgi:predicted double-glycine peptidase
MLQTWTLGLAFATAFRVERQSLDCAQGILLAVFCWSLAACGGTRMAVPVRPVSFLALRYEATIPQQFDYTCGAASVATTLTYYWDRPTTETEVIDVLKRRYSLEEIARRRETGLSFDDLIFAAAGLGFEAQGAQIALEELPKLQGPAIVQLVNSKFQHFVVLRRVGVGVYYISDPIVGQLAMNAPDFRREFSGYALAIWRSGVPLPTDAKLSRPRDGLSVTNSMEKVINAGSWYSHPVF